MEQAIQLMLKDGLSATAAAKRVAVEHSVSSRTIFRWADHDGRPLAPINPTAEAGRRFLEARRAAFEERRLIGALEMARASAVMRDVSIQAAAAHDARLLQASAIACGIYVDKWRLLSGESTVHVETKQAEQKLTREELIAQAIKLRDEVEARRQRNRASAADS